MKKKICVYKITSPTNKVYIGSTLNYERRLDNYKNLKCKSQRKLYYSLQKYGFDKHRIEMLCQCDIENVRQQEGYYGQLFDCLGENGLNCYLPKHEGFISMGKETRKKMSNAKKGRARSEETRKKISTTTKGRSISEAVKLKISAANTGRKFDDAFRQKVSVRCKGVKLSEARILKRTMAQASILLNQETGIYYYGYMEAGRSKGVSHTCIRKKIVYNKPTAFILT